MERNGTRPHLISEMQRLETKSWQGCVFSLGLLLSLGGLPSEARPQEQASQAAVAQVRRATVAAVSPENEQKLRNAFDRLYNLEFEPALELFEEVAQAEPESAAATAFWASALLYEILAHQGSLQSQLFVTSNEFLRHARVPIDPALEEKFHAVSEEAEQRARRRLAANRDDLDGLFARGLVHGNRANYLAGVKTKYFAGLRQGEKAYDYHQRLRKLRPELHDAAVVLGLRNYVLGSLSRTQRFFLLFIGARSNRQQGLRYLEEAATQADFLRAYGQILLVVARLRENHLEQALPLAEELQTRYPRNPIFLVELARLYRRLERYPEAARASRDLLAELTMHPHNPPVLGPEDALLELGLVEAAQGDFSRALETFDRVEQMPEGNRHAQTQAVLERGKIFDRQGKREQALVEYDRVINLAVHIKFTRPALNYKRRPYQPDEEE
ncbi:MAG: tetratricopeptide repeat protein [Terriglobia bacterium]